MNEHRTPSLAGSSGKDSPSLAGWGNAAISGRLGGTVKTDQLRESFQTYIGPCESPIETMMATGLLYAIGGDMYERAAGPCGEAVRPCCEIETQRRVGPYRVDIALIGQDVKVAIECDGHEFHEKTKEQAARDKARDRELISSGYTVLRFSGSEIWADPLGCAHQALGIAKQQQADAAVAAYEAGRGA